jgi:serine/threonine-protein kinase
LTETLAEGRYRIERALGHGGMAVVYLANDEELDRRVAVKVLAENLANDETFRARFLQEARFAGRLSHPNIVHVYDAGETEGRPFIVMEYVPGATLAQCETLPPHEAVALVLQACAGLQHAHEAGLVHRDLKPANLLLREDGVLKIADFGIARAAEATRLTQLGTILGTAAYLSPEQAAGEEVTAATDIYSLGAVLYELLTGQLPYRFESLGELALKQRDGVITPVRDIDPRVPEPVEAAVMHCLARDPQFRPASAAELAQELAGASDPAAKPPVREADQWRGSGGTGRFPQTTHAAVRRLPGARTIFFIATAVAVAALAVILGLLRLGGGSSSGTPKPVPVTGPARGATPSAEAHNLSDWLRGHSR